MSASPDKPASTPDHPDAPRLNPEDQARVDGFLSRGVNAVPRKPFRPLLLLVILVVIVTALTGLSLFLERAAGVY